MTTFLGWLTDRLGERTTWYGIAAFLGGVGGSLATAGFPKSGAIVASIGAGATGVALFIMKEQA